MKITEDMLEDGAVLRSLIELYNKNGDRKTYAMILQCLRDSYVYVPCKITVNGELLNGIYEDDFSRNDEVVIEPDFLYSENQDKFFPVFSSEEFLPVDRISEMSGLRKHFMDVVDWVNEIRDVDGILVDAFMNMFVCDVSYFPLLREMDSLFDGDRVLS